MAKGSEIHATVTVLRGANRDWVEFPGLRVRVVSSRGAEHSAELGLSPVLVGTSEECELPIVDDGVSRNHCEVQLTAQGVVLKDLGSKNGTFVGSVRVREAFLPLGVSAHLGASRLWVEATGGSTELPLSPTASFGAVRGASVAMRALFAQLQRVAPTDEPVLLIGESGTGKELLAQALHAHSARKGGPFVVVDCASLSTSLVEAELFGSEAGAFTGATSTRAGLLEEANGGTLFLDEVGELPTEIQTRFLRVLETREVRRLGSNEARPANSRVIAATHRDIRAQLKSGAFRQDLYFRLAVLEARVPPLRERGDDLVMLLEDLLGQLEPPRALGDLPPGTLELFRSHHWPGNVRELRNAVTRLMLNGGTGDALSSAEKAPAGRKWTGLPLREARGAMLASFERQYLEKALAAHDGNVTAAAKALGVSRQIVHRLLQRHQLRGGDDD